MADLSSSWEIFLTPISDVTRSYLGIDEAPTASNKQDTGQLEELFIQSGCPESARSVYCPS